MKKVEHDKLEKNRGRKTFASKAGKTRRRKMNAFYKGNENGWMDADDDDEL